MRPALVLVGIVVVAGFVFGQRALARLIVASPNGGHPAGSADPRAETLRLASGEALAYLIVDPGGHAPRRGTLLALHGMNGRKEAMSDLAAGFAGEGFRVVVPDLRGHGGSSGAFIGYGHLEAPDLIALLDHLDLDESEPLGVLGFSYGGAAALHLAAIDARVRSVGTVATFSSMEAAVASHVRAHAPSLPLPRAVIAFLVASAGRLAGFDAALADSTRAAATTRADVLVLHGEDDAVVPVAQARALAAAAGARARRGVGGGAAPRAPRPPPRPRPRPAPAPRRGRGRGPCHRPRRRHRDRSGRGARLARALGPLSRVAHGLGCAVLEAPAASRSCRRYCVPGGRAMATTTVRISTAAHEALKSIAEREGSSVRAVIERAVEDLRRKRFLQAVNDSYAELRSDEHAWAEVVREREAWDAALTDGLGAAPDQPPGKQSAGRRAQRRGR